MKGRDMKGDRPGEAERSVLMRAENLCAGYGHAGHSRADRDVLKNLSFSLREGERLCVIGPNGSGKTTLLRVLAGTLPYRGSLTVSAQGVMRERSSLPVREAAKVTGFLAQLSQAYFSFTVSETVMLGRYAHQKHGISVAPAASDREAVERALSVCGIAELKGERLSRLSGGQLQRVFLARTFAQDPTVMLLDEPSNHLDLRYQLELLRGVEGWIERGEKAAIGVFHDLTLAFRFADSVILLDEGRIADSGTPRSVFKGQAINRAYRMNVAETMRELLQNW